MEFQEIRIENTNHCGYSCWFCPREKQSRTLGFMSIETFKKIIQKLPNDVLSIDLHGFGEPLLDPQLGEKVSFAREKWKDADIRIITTMGQKDSAKKIIELARCGMSTVEVSFYGNSPESYKSIHGVNRFSLATENISYLKSNKPKNLSIVVRELEGVDSNRKNKVKTQNIIKGKLHNFGNGRSFNTTDIYKVCSIVNGYRRRVLQITWDGKIIP